MHGVAVYTVFSFTAVRKDNGILFCSVDKNFMGGSFYNGQDLTND